MAPVGEIAWHVSGDIGGLGISRFRFVTQTSGTIVQTDANAVAAAVRLFLNPLASNIPSTVTWTCDPVCKVYDHITGLVLPPVPITTVPAPVVGSSSAAHGAGLGLRVNWKTDTVSGRRLIKGATFVVPLASGAYQSDGSIFGTVITTANNAAAAYLAAVTTANCNPVIWHRPPKGATSGGLTGVTFAGQGSTTPAGLRSRRS